jgi:hypothetical protein
MWFITYGTQQDALDAAVIKLVHALPSQTLASPVCFPPMSTTAYSRLYTISTLHVQPYLNDLPQVSFDFFGHASRFVVPLRVRCTCTCGSWTSPPPVTPVHFCARHLLPNMRAPALGGAVHGGRHGFGLAGELQLQANFTLSANNRAESANSATEESRRAHCMYLLDYFATLFRAHYEYGEMPIMDWDTPPPSLISASSSSTGDVHDAWDGDHPRLPSNFLGG